MKNKFWWLTSNDLSNVCANLGWYIVSKDGIVSKIPAHVSKSSSEKGANGAGAISCMIAFPSSSQIVTGCGSVGANDQNIDVGSVSFIDLRMKNQVLSRWSSKHGPCQNGVYSMCAVGNSCVFVGDGAGNCLCYDLVNAKNSETSTTHYAPGCSYAFGASLKGAVRSINCVNGKVVCCCEDGNVLIVDYAGA